MSKSEKNIPILVGVGEITNRSGNLSEALEPVELIAQAVYRALEDTGVHHQVKKGVDSLDLVGFVSWPYDDSPRRIARAVGIECDHCRESEWGGNVPNRLVDDAAARIAKGDTRMAVVCGGEALKTLERYQRLDQTPPWPERPVNGRELDFRDFVSQTVWDYGLYMPIRAYPLWENAFRADCNLSFEENQQWSAHIWEKLSEVAFRNPNAWNPQAVSADKILTPSGNNRMICHPYTKLMNAIMAVDQAAAVILTNVEFARELNIPQEKWLYLWSGAGMGEREDFLQRPHYKWSPGLQGSLDGALSASGLTPADIDLFEIYSCFPIVPKLAVRHLGIRDDQVSITGGLTFFGGPGNNYTTHGLAAAARAIRRGKGGTALVYGQCGFMIKHHTIIVGSEPPPGGYISANTGERQASIDAKPYPPLLDKADGRCEIETYTVVYDRNNEPDLGIVVGLTQAGERFVAHTLKTDLATLDGLIDPQVEPVGRRGLVRNENGVNYFQLT